MAPRARAGTPLPVHFTAVAAPNPVRAGEVVTVTVRANVDAGWHIYSVVPTPNGPSATVIQSLGNWKPLGPTTEDAPVQKQDPNFGAVVGFHEKAATFTRAFRVPGHGDAGLAPLPRSGDTMQRDVAFHYQTCNARICLPPTDVTLPVTLTVETGAARAQFVQAPQVSPAPQGKAGVLIPRREAATRSNGTLAFLLAAVGAGLLAILTPCVFPLIPITLTNFVKASGGHKGKLVRLSGGYALGIVALYVGLGMVVALTLGAAGANQIAANPYVNLGEFALFVVFAFSFFEVIQLHLPGNLGALQQKARAHTGMAGLALLGITFVLGSFTCTAPFVGTLLVSAAGGSLARPLLGMTAFALAFVSPFLVFAAFPQWIARLPKSGAWLTLVKGTLGFVELAAALKFLSNADQVWQWRVLTQPVLLAAWAVVFFCAALYLGNALRFGPTAGDAPAPTSPMRRVFGGAFLGAALYCFWGLAGRPLSPFVGAFLPPAGYGGGEGAGDARVLPWLTDYNAALALAKAEGRPLLIDFTGYTCTNCRLNEKRVFPLPAVQRAFTNFVRVQLYTDGGADGPRNQRLQQAKFGDVALPLYGIVDAQTGAVLGKTEGVQSPDGFAQFLKQGQSLAQKPGNELPGWGAQTPVALRAKEADAPPIPSAVRQDGWPKALQTGNSLPGIPDTTAHAAPGTVAATAHAAPGIPDTTGNSLSGTNAAPPQATPQSWRPYSPQAAQEAAAQGKPAVIDFTAKWCVNCKAIERTVFDAPSVAPALTQNFATFRADLTQWNTPASLALQKQYRFDSLPTIVFVGADGREIRGLRVTGLLSIADFQRRMAQAQAVRFPEVVRTH